MGLVIERHLAKRRKGELGENRNLFQLRQAKETRCKMSLLGLLPIPATQGPVKKRAMLEVWRDEAGGQKDPRG